MATINTLVGHSGCDVQLLTENNLVFVRKTSSGLRYNKRLEKQCQKQRLFKSEFVSAPRVIDSGYKCGLFYFDMEFINGQSFNKLVKNSDFKSILYYFELILNFISENLKESSLVSFRKEIEQKLKSIRVGYNIPKITITEKASILNTGYSHGDLTFENILVKDGKVFLIDFLDSYIDSPIIDLSKLKQDLILDWSNRFEYRDNLSLIKNQWLNKYLDDFVDRVGLSSEAVELQRKITFLRILPYTDNIYTQLKIIEKL